MWSPKIPQTGTTEEKLRAIVEQIHSYIEFYHGGSLKLISFDGETIKVKLGGACEGCSMAATTLKGWVGGTIRQFFPEVTQVVAV
jgi:Fe-S cluster biogenesis protein NfuA